MTSTRLIIDLSEDGAVDRTLARIAASPGLTPFADETIGFVAELSRRLRRASRGNPALTALAYWMRRSELVRLRDDFASLSSADVILVPRGSVLHIPPANVDTIFVYSWLLSLLVGNKNVVRVPSRSTETIELILAVLAELLAEDEYEIHRERTAFVRYGHDDVITGRLSAAADARVIWGGDTTVQQIRRVPLAPHAVELTFPDRFSMAVIDTLAYLDESPAGRDELAEAFYNDAFWFDQMGCSSPRIVYWRGRAAAAEATTDFYNRVGTVVRDRGYAIDTAVALRKLTYAHEAAIDHRLRSVRGAGLDLSVLELERPESVHGSFVGAGTFYDVQIDDLSDIAAFVDRRDQTLSHFGIGRDDLHAFVAQLNGRGIDRMVPIGQALDFSRYWDGHDLLQSFCHRVVVRTVGGTR